MKQNYRKRDARNDLSHRININRPRPISKSDVKKRVKISNISLDTSDFTVDDMIKEFGDPIFSKFYEDKDSRTAVYEFKDPENLNKVVEKYNNTVLNNATLKVEIISASSSRNKRVRDFSVQKGNYGKPRRFNREPCDEQSSNSKLAYF